MSVNEKITITFDKFTWVIDYDIHNKVETGKASYDEGKFKLILDLILTLQRKAWNDLNAQLMQDTYLEKLKNR